MVLVDGKTVVDIKAILSACKVKGLSIKAKNTSALIVKNRRHGTHPYITATVLHDLRDFTHAFRECTEVENADTMCIVKTDASPGGAPQLMLAILEYGFDCGMGQPIGRGKLAEPISVLIEHPF